LAEAHKDNVKNQHKMGHRINALMPELKTSGTSAPNEPQVRSFGSGFIISNNGYVLTCYHVITDSQVIKVRFDDNLLSAKVVCKDLNNDLALLKISGMFPALTFSTKPTAKVGQDVFAIGYPNPIVLGVNEKLSRGLIFSMIGFQDDIRLYQINVPIQPGNSGGPLLDMHGNVIGIVLAMSSRTAFKEWGSSSLLDNNFAINSTYAKALLDTIPEEPDILLPEFKKETFDNVVERVKKSVVMIVAYK
jgi:S1-C subfamily serine protease